MKDLTLPDRVRATSDAKDALDDATYVIHAVPVQYSREFLKNVEVCVFLFFNLLVCLLLVEFSPAPLCRRRTSFQQDFLPPHTPILSASKGIETTSLGFMADILKECCGSSRSYAFLSGPSFAREVVDGMTTAVVIASEDHELADDLADIMTSDTFKVFTSHDVIGVEVGGSVKNVIAIAAGMCEGLKLGTNAMSALVTRGCGEMRRLGLYLGAEPSTLAGLSGVGGENLSNTLHLSSLRKKTSHRTRRSTHRHIRNLLRAAKPKPKLWHSPGQGGDNGRNIEHHDGSCRGRRYGCGSSEPDQEAEQGVPIRSQVPNHFWS